MIVKKILREYVKTKKLVNEGISVEGTPDMKYYAFDWDDNIVTMPTQIIVSDENAEEVGISTEDFAKYREMIGKTPFDYKGRKIVGYASDPYRNFTKMGDKQFLVDAMIAEPGPSWNDFVECINGGSIFAIITARGHNPKVLKDAVFAFIVTNHNGINQDECVSNLKRFRELAGDTMKSEKQIINDYLNMCQFSPVTYGEGSASNPEEGKIKALRKFITDVKNMAEEIGKKAYFKNDVSNRFVPEIGFSDDDPRNIEKIKQFIDSEYEDKPVRTYLTKGGEKKEV